MRESIRDRAESMPPAQAVAMLLDMLELTAPEHRPETLDRLRLAGFRPTEARVFALLLGSHGRTLTRDHICARCCGEDADSRVVDCHIANIRRRIAAKGWPVTITAVWGDGYAMTVPEGWAP